MKHKTPYGGAAYENSIDNCRKRFQRRRRHPESTPEFLASQMDCIFTDIFPDAVKTGMVSSAPLIRVIADKLRQYRAKNIVVDPVMVSTSGFRLLSEDAVDALKEQLLPLASVLTPNIPEAEVLSGEPIAGPEERGCGR